MATELETKTKVIGGLAYSVTLLDAKQGRRVLTRIARVATPLLAGGFSSDSTEKLSTLIANALSNLDDETMDFLCQTFGAATRVKFASGQSSTLEDEALQGIHFAGKYLEMGQWLAFCLEVNFSGFFAGLLQAFASLLNAQPAATQPS